MDKRQDDDQPPALPTQPAEDGDKLTPEEEAALDAVWADVDQDALRASVKRSLEWAKTLKKREGEGKP